MLSLHEFRALTSMSMLTMLAQVRAEAAAIPLFVQSVHGPTQSSGTDPYQEGHHTAQHTPNPSIFEKKTDPKQSPHLPTNRYLSLANPPSAPSTPYPSPTSPKILAGLPPTTHQLGTTIPAGTTAPSSTTAKSFKIAIPPNTTSFPICTWFPTLAASTTARSPTNTWSPIFNG